MTDQTQHTDWQHTTQLSTHNDWPDTTQQLTTHNTVTDNRAEVLVKQLITVFFKCPVNCIGCCCRWSPLHSAILCFQADSFCSHVTIHEFNPVQSTAPSGSIHMQNVFHVCTTRVNPHTELPSCPHHQGQPTYRTSLMSTPPGSIHIQNFLHVHTTRVNPHAKLLSCPYYQGQPTYKTSFMSVPSGSTHIQNFFHVCTTRVNPHAKLLSCL